VSTEDAMSAVNVIEAILESLDKGAPTLVKSI